MRALVVAVWLLSSSVVVAKGKTVDIDIKQGAVDDFMRVLGDTGKVNVVVLEGGDTKVDVLAKNVPWDKVLADTVAKANLAFVREGNVVIVGSQAAIDARKATKKAKASGPMIQLDLVGASPKDAALLIAVATGTAFDLDGGDAVSLRLRQVKASVAKDIVGLVSKATVAASPAKRAIGRAKGACVAPKLPANDLQLVGIAGIGTKRWAMFGTMTSAETFVVTQADCLGLERRKVKAISPTWLVVLNEADGRVEEFQYQLYPAQLPIGTP
ncbi:MAG: hypothetical protein ACKV2T_12165 [Kofleriaceae bacterium]